MKTLILVAGARPNFMKVAPVLHALKGRLATFRPALVHTGQHYDEQMSGVFFEQLGLPAPDAHLGAGGGTHGQQTGRIVELFEKYLLEQAEKPAGVVVVGDVNSTVACALAAVKLGIPVAHLEAGLRSYDRTMPEEINRLATDAISDLLLVSEPAGEENLRKEGVSPDRIRYVGNVMIDTLVAQLPEARALRLSERMNLKPGGYALVTLHRPGNVDDVGRLRELLDVLDQVTKIAPVVFPAHPRTRPKLDGIQHGLTVVDPLPYREMLSLQADAGIVITDSGGMQEETSYLGVPCLTLRPNTERPVTTTLGTNTLIDRDLGRVAKLAADALAGSYRKAQPIPGWDGKAAIRVVEALEFAWRG
jgi:UDP-N-acetylglucosamine 2-epimerase (non-hydrolysing)